MEPIAAACTDFVLGHARRHPSVKLDRLAVTPVGAGTYRVTAWVANRGQLASHVTNKGRGLARFPPVSARLRPASGVVLLSGTEVTW